MASIRPQARQRALKTNWWVALMFSCCRITGPAAHAKTEIEFLRETWIYAFAGLRLGSSPAVRPNHGARDTQVTFKVGPSAPI